jgi:predicted secreted Zn-dependent protease
MNSTESPPRYVEVGRIVNSESGTCLGRRYLLAAIAACLPMTALAEVVENLETETYDVPAVPGRTVRQLINQHTPIDRDGRRFHGYTKWWVDWRWRHRESRDGRCTITSVKVNLKGHILLPRILNGTSSQNAVFERYLAALKEHEEGHYQFGLEAARSIDRALLELPSYPSCKELSAEANATARALLRDQMEKEKQYDRDTRHGATQGVVLKE